MIRDVGFIQSRRRFLKAGIAVGGLIATGLATKSDRSPSHPEIIHDDLGSSIGRIAREEGYEAVIKVHNPKGPYIIHFAQTHDSDGILTGDVKNNVIQSQKSIYNMLDRMYQEVGGQRICYQEGSFPKQSEEYFAVLGEIRDSLNNKYTPDKPDIWRSLSSYYSDMRLILKKHSYQDSWIMDSINYLINKKYKQLRGHFIGIFGQEYLPQDELEAASFTTLSSIIEVFEDGSKIRYDNQDYAFALLGAPLKLFLDEKIDTLLGAEDPKEHREATELLDNIDRLQSDVYLGEYSDEEKDAIVSQLTGLLNQEDKEVMQDREDAFLKIVSESELIDKTRIIPVSYGLAHDFSDQVRQFNNKNPNNRLGLIVISSSNR